MITEKFYPEILKNGGIHLTLSKLALSETVKVYLAEKEVIPQAFDIYGYPSFSEDQVMLMWSKVDHEKHEKANYCFPIFELTVTYEQRFLDTSCWIFCDNASEMSKLIPSYDMLREILYTRKLCAAVDRSCPLHKFVIFGHIYLDKDGNNYLIKNESKGPLNSTGIVMTYAAFSNINPHFSWDLSFPFELLENPICPHCGRKIGIDDVKNDNCYYIGWKNYHRKCDK